MASMSKRFTGVVAGTLMCLSAPAAALAAGPATVTVRVEGTSGTLVAAKKVTTTLAPVVKDGNPAHSCTGTSAAGALELATKTDWTGAWSDGLGYFVSSVKSEAHSGSPDFWSFWVGNKSATTGICGAELRDGQSLLFFVDSCDYDAATQGCKNQPVLPLAIRAPRTVKAGQKAVLTVVRYDANGKAKPVAKASIKRRGAVVGRTDAKGRIRLSSNRRGLKGLQAIKAGFVRSEVVSVPVRG
jgi:hypothetical protein